MTERAVNALPVVTDLRVVLTIIARLVALGAAFLNVTICSVVVVALSLTFTELTTWIRHQEFEGDVVVVVPAASAVSSLQGFIIVGALSAGSAWPLAVKFGEHNLKDFILDE